jgi:hypothetical protein
VIGLIIALSVILYILAWYETTKDSHDYNSKRKND